MCFAPPARIVDLAPGRATVEREGARFDVSQHLLDRPVAVGDYVAVQAQRYAVAWLSESEAEEARMLYRQIIESIEA